MQSDFDPAVAFARLEGKVDAVGTGLGVVDGRLQNVEKQTTLTNGRVSKIEMERAAEYAVKQAAEKHAANQQVRWSWAPPAAVSFLIFAAGVAVSHLL